MEAILGTIILISIAVYAKKRRNKYHSKKCPRCNHYPCDTKVTNLVWKGTIGAPVYDYKCPKCGYKFDNSPF